MGRILRKKKNSARRGSEFDAFFYTLLSTDTRVRERGGGALAPCASEANTARGECVRTRAGNGRLGAAKAVPGGAGVPVQGAPSLLKLGRRGNNPLHRS